MPPKSRRAIAPAVPQTHGAKPRCMQTSGIFRLPAELIVEVLAYFRDPHHNIQSIKKSQGPPAVLDPDDVERLTVIRMLTMTCWHLRNMLFPLLWKYVEGCNVSYRHSHRTPTREDGNGLYAQCVYLILNPTICAYVQILSADLQFKNAPKDLMAKFVDCLVQLPNLRALEVFSTSRIRPITAGLKQKRARLPSVRQLGVSVATAEFVGSCPDVESVVVLDGLSWYNIEILSSFSGELGRLKRFIGVESGIVPQVVQGCPDLQEIGIHSEIILFNRLISEVRASEVAGHLRSLKRLAVVELYFLNLLISLEPISKVEHELHRAQMKADLEVLKAHLIQVLKESPSNERKFLRWKVAEHQYYRGATRNIVVVENGELEVLPET